MTPSCEFQPLAYTSSRSGRRRRRFSPFRLAVGEDGATAIEFAVVAPVFLLLVSFIAELALVFIVEELMDRAVRDSARLVRTGQVQAANMNRKAFHEALCRNIIAFVDCESKNFYFDVTAYDRFSAVDSTPPVNKAGEYKGSGKTEFGGPSDIVVLRVYYQWPTSPIFGETSLANLENGRRLVGSMAAFRNEPFAPAPGGRAGAAASAGAGTGPGTGPGSGR